MQITETNATGLKREYKVVVPADALQGQIETRLKELGERIRMPGFRPGKVPLKVVAQQYGTQVRQEVLGDAMQRSFGEAVRQRNLRVAGYPKFEPQPVTQGAAEFQYSATFEIYPEVKMPSGPGALGRDARPEGYRMERREVAGADRTDLHVKDFIECVRSRRQPVATVEAGHRASTVAHLGNLGLVGQRDY